MDNKTIACVAKLDVSLEDNTVVLPTNLSINTATAMLVKFPIMSEANIIKLSNVNCIKSLDSNNHFIKVSPNIYSLTGIDFNGDIVNIIQC